MVFVNRSVLLRGLGMVLWEPGPADSTTVVSHDGSVSLSLDGCETGVYVKRLVFDLEPLTEQPVSLKVRVTCLKNGSEAVQYEYHDCQPLYLRTEVLDVDRDHVIFVEISGETELVTGAPVFRVGRIRIDDRFRFEPYVFGFGFLFGLGLLLLLSFRDKLRKKPELVFLLTALTMGVAMTACLPRNKVGYDEETHLQAVMDMASFPSGELHLSDAVFRQMLVTEYNHPDAQPGGGDEMAEWDTTLTVLGDYRQGAHTPDFYTMPNRMPAYLAMAAAVKLAKGLHLSWPGVLLAARLGNLLMYTLLMTLAIRTVPRGKWLMMLIGLFPVSMFLACTVSYDPFITGTLFLGYALLMRGRRYLLPAMACIVLGCLAKAVYAPVAMMAVLLLRRPEGTASYEAEESDRGQHAGFNDQTTRRLRTRDWLLLCGCGVVVIALAAAFILPTVLAPSASGDIRGGAVSEVDQISFILRHPLRYASILCRQMIRWIPQCWFGADCTTFMGHVVNGDTPSRGFYPVYLLMLAGTVAVSWLPARPESMGAAGGRSRRNRDFHPAARLWILLAAGAAAVLIWTSMYVAFTEPGAEEIAGVQGRYFLPLMFPVYMALSGRGEAEGAALESGPALWYYLLELAAYLMMALTVWTFVVSRFCL